jgi:outer membrane receptor protein involved in Fe transport
MRKIDLLCASAIALVAAIPASAQTGDTTSAQSTAPTNGRGQDAPSSTPTYGQDIVVTAQRQSQRLQDVPIAVSAFTAENLEKQQIPNPLALQQTLPNVTFTKTNFSSSSFTIRGIGDLCVGVTCDSATALHMNDMPLLGSRMLDAEFFDLERIEVLRGPQGTLFGRNATAGVLNVITAKADLSGVRAAGEFEYGNYDSKRLKGMFNLPLTDTLAVRVAGTYLNRDGYTKNLYTGRRIDGRDIWSVRGTLSWEPSPDTRLDLIAQYTKEDDNRSRIQKQLCNRDPTGVLGCSPDQRGTGTTNFNSTLGSILTSREFLGIAVQPGFAGTGLNLTQFGLGSIYGTDAFAGVVNPRDVRTVSVDFEPRYKTTEQVYTAKLFHDFGPMSLSLTGGYLRSTLDAQTDYNLAVENAPINNSGLVALDALARPGSPYAFLNGMRQALIPNGPNGGLCQSSSDPNNVGIYGGNSQGCYPQSLDFDRSTGTSRMFSGEAHVDSSFDGMFNFLLGGIYVDSKSTDVDYYVNSFALDYATGLLGSAATAATGGNSFSASPFFRSNSQLFRLKSYGIFGETYFTFNDKLKLTLGARYNHDDKYVRARTSLANGPLPIGSTNADSLFNSGNVDFDPGVAGNQTFAVTTVAFSRVTGRAVLDYKISPDNLLYASYSRGYKSGGVNPPLSAGTLVTRTFRPEQVDSFEIGSKNTFGNGQLRLNLTGFYYKYKDLQLTRIVQRTSVNDNISADIYGVEAEAIISPVPAFVVNANFSYLKTKVSQDVFLPNPRDVSGGRSDAVIIKDITNASNCAIVANTAGNVAGVNGFVSAVNASLGLRGPVAVPGTNTTGAYSICSVLAGAAASTASPYTVLTDGFTVNVRGNRLPNAPTYKFAVGAQYTIDAGSSGYTIVPRVDLNYTGNSYGTIFNVNPIDKIPGYEVVNAQIQFNAPDDRFYVRGFVTNLTGNDSITGLYVTDQSSGLYTNIFTIEPRRYGVAAGFKF